MSTPSPLIASVAVALLAGTAGAISGCATTIEGDGDDQLRYGVLEGPGGRFRAHYRVEGDDAVIDDMILPLPSVELELVGFADPRDDGSNLWPGGVIPYRVLTGPVHNGEFSDAQLETIRQAIAGWNAHSSATGVAFQETADVEDEVVIIPGVPGANSNSSLGRIGGVQFVRLKLDTMDEQTVLHELGHAIGLWHEHQRPDRTVDIDLTNVPEEFHWSLEPYEGGTPLGPYDLHSVMHYRGFLKSALDPDRPVFIAHDGTPSEEIGGLVLSPGDIAAVAELYAAVVAGD